MDDVSRRRFLEMVAATSVVAALPEALPSDPRFVPVYVEFGGSSPVATVKSRLFFQGVELFFDTAAENRASVPTYRID